MHLHNRVREAALGLLALCCGCGSTQVNRPQAPYAAIRGPVIVAHRGGALEAPENTLSAFQHAITSGVDWLELDVHLAADNGVVVVHDSTLERTTDGTGPVRDKTTTELTTFRAGRPRPSATRAAALKALGVEVPDFGNAYNDAHIPTLQDVLRLGDIRIMIELKVDEGTNSLALAQAVVDVVRAAHAHDRVILGSFDTALLWAIRDIAPALPLVGIAKNIEGVKSMLGLPVVVLAVTLDLLKETLEVAPAGIAVWAWTMYSTSMVEQAVLQGAHGIITDIPSATVGLLRKPQDLYIKLGE